MARLPWSEPGQSSLSERIVQFQEQAGLIPDGILGPQTLIELATATEPDVPRLTALEERG